VNWAFAGIQSYVNYLIITIRNVKGVLHRLGHLSFSICFYLLIVCCTVCSTVLWYYNYPGDDMLRTVSCHKISVDLVYRLFDDYIVTVNVYFLFLLVFYFIFIFIVTVIFILRSMCVLLLLLCE